MAGLTIRSAGIISAIHQTLPVAVQRFSLKIWLPPHSTAILHINQTLAQSMLILVPLLVAPMVIAIFTSSLIIGLVQLRNQNTLTPKITIIVIKLKPVYWQEKRFVWIKKISQLIQKTMATILVIRILKKARYFGIHPLFRKLKPRKMPYFMTALTLPSIKNLQS